MFALSIDRRSGYLCFIFLVTAPVVMCSKLTIATCRTLGVVQSLHMIKVVAQFEAGVTNGISVPL